MELDMMYVDWVVVIVIIISFVVFGISLCLSRMPDTAFGTDNNERLKDAVKVRNNWIGSNIAFLFFHYWCILFSILATIIVLYLSCFEQSNNDVKARIMIYSALSLFTSILPYVVKMEKISKKYRMAYVTLLKEILGNDSISKAIISGEKEINKGFDE